MSIRPENIRILEDSDNKPNGFKGTIQQRQFSGALVEYEIGVSGEVLRVKSLMSATCLKHKVGAEVWLGVDPNQVRVLSG